MVWSFNKFADNTAVIRENGEKVLYSELSRDSDKLYSAIGSRCLVFCICTNTYASLLGYLTFVNNHVVPVMINSGLDSKLLSGLLEKYKPDYIWAPDDMAFEELTCDRTYSFEGYSLFKTAFDHVYPMADELALLLTTSGSTGSPKLVRQSYDNILSNTESIVEYLSINEKEIAITSLPMYYTFGISVLNSHIYAGASIVVTEKKVTQKEFWAQLKDNKVTSLAGVPYTYEMLDRLRFCRMDLPYLTTLTQAGGKLPYELHKKYAEYAQSSGKRFFVMYGQTEATARMSYLPADRSLEKCGSIGIAIPGGEFSLIDAEGNVISQPEVCGELVFKGRNVTLGYAQSGEDLNDPDERCGVLRTGDIAKRDKDGFYYIVGRMKRFLKLFGSRVNLDETENMLNAQFPSLKCVCGGVDGKLYIFYENDADSDELIRFISQKTSFHHSAFTAVKIDMIPRSDSGKVIYSELEKYYE